MSTRHFILIMLVGFSLALSPLPALAETEPNNDPSTANVLALNGSDSGTLGGTDVDDWWKVTIPADGRLYIETNSDATVEIDLSLYDLNGTNQIASYDISWGTKESTHRNDLLPGTYYVQVHRYSGSGSYTILSQYAVPSLPNDPEPNDSVDAAVALSLNGSATGHLGFYGNDFTDFGDWWILTTNVDGKLLVSTLSDSTLEIDLYLYDEDKATQIASYDISWGVYETTHFDNLMPGTYYVHAFRFSGYGSYTISNQFTSATLPNDSEPNDSAQVAQTLQVDGSSTGHLGFYNFGFYDVYDWWKVTTPSDGKLTVRTLSDSTAEIDLYTYDVDGTTQIASYDIAYGANEATHHDNVMPGTYYVLAHRWSGYGSYTISSEFTPARLADDSEPNDSLAAAKPVAIQIVQNGHLGYYTSGFTDREDYVSFAIPALWDTLFVRSDTEPTLEADLYLYDALGNQISYSSVWGTTELIARPNTGAGTYYLLLYRWSGYGSYAFIVSNVRPMNPLVSVEDELAALPQEYLLYQNYPNPFNPVTTIRFDLPESGHVSLKVYDVIGQEVVVLVDEERDAGVHRVKFNGGSLPSGAYIYRLQARQRDGGQANGFVETKKLIFLK